MSSDLVVKTPIRIVKTAFDSLGRIFRLSTARPCQLPTSQNEETIGLDQLSTVPDQNYPTSIPRARNSSQGFSLSSFRGPLRAALLFIMCTVIVCVVPSLPVHGFDSVYPFLRAIVQKDDSVFGLAYSDTQPKQQPLHHANPDTSNHATLIKRLDGSMQEGSIILIADIIALVFFVVVIAVAGWVLLRRRRNQAAQQRDSSARQNDLEAPQPQNATKQDGKVADGGLELRMPYPRSTNSSMVWIPTPGSSTFRSLRMSMIPTPTRVHRPVTISNPISVKSTMEWHELDPYPHPGFGPEGPQMHNSKPQQRNRQSEPPLSRKTSGATTVSKANSLQKLAGILKGDMRFSGASYPEEAALSETTHGILSRQASSSSRVSIATVISPKDDQYRVSSDAPAVPPIPRL